MFKGAAWFSPSVPRYVRRLWVKNGGKRAGRGKDGIRRRLWYCFLNGPQDPKLADVKSRGLVAHHALWIADSVKLGRALPIEQYQIDEPLRPGLEVVLQSPKRRHRLLALDSSAYSSPYTIDSNDREMSLDASSKADMSVDHDVELDGVFPSPSRLSDFRTDHDSSSVFSWDVTPLTTFGFEDDYGEEEDEKSRVEMLIDTEDACEEKDILDWSELIVDPSHQEPTCYDQATSPSLELDASLTMSQLSSLYPHVLEGATLFLPHKVYKGNLFTASRRRKSNSTSHNSAS
ncbi:unnamed protein product [Rhizoctonia solani]|uniref:BRCT domain-containing protein n=1 Tax=Rhizoctonia solani TaxID=456999 RepID=A0A8H3BC45_9AGAM|nr:unnamed protein product [Rhizoctonia solani]